MRPPDRRAAGFTLIEMMVTITIIGLAMSAIFGFGRNLLPQARLEASARDIGDAMVRMRTHALFSQRDVVFEYDLDQQGFSAFYPYDLDPDDGHILGPGKTVVLPFTPTREGMAIDHVLLADGTEREDGQVQVALSTLGDCPAHDVVVLNPEFPELEIYTVRMDSLVNTYHLFDGHVTPVLLSDADFR